MVDDIIDVGCALNIGDELVVIFPLSWLILRAHQERAHANNCLTCQVLRAPERSLVSVVGDSFLSRAKDGLLVFVGPTDRGQSGARHRLS